MNLWNSGFKLCIVYAGNHPFGYFIAEKFVWINV